MMTPFQLVPPEPGTSLAHFHNTKKCDQFGIDYWTQSFFAFFSSCVVVPGGAKEKQVCKIPCCIQSKD